MKQRQSITVLIISLVVSLFSPVTAGLALDCANSEMSGPNNCFFYGGMGTVSETTLSINNQVQASNMYPYGQDLDLSKWHAQALLAIDNGNALRDDLTLLCIDDPDTPDIDESDCLPETCPEVPSGDFDDLYCFPELNYEDVGLISFSYDENGTPISFSLDKLDSRLINAITTFGYEICDKQVQVPPEDNSQEQADLREAIKVVVSIYLMIGDEFLVDALEWRFSAGNLHADVQLDEQLVQLAKARLLYDAAVAAFVEGFNLQMGNNCLISSFFDQSVFNLFHLSVERMATAMRETSSKQLARKMSPGAESGAMSESKSVLQESYISTYLATAAAAQSNDQFVSEGGDRLLTALKSLQQHSAIYLGNLNPLGFDDRYIPMQDYNPTLRDRALSALGIAQTSLGTFVAEKRMFDSNLEQLRATHNTIAQNGYREQLSSLTGISVEQIQTYYLSGDFTPVETSGDELYDCDPENLDFDTCIEGTDAGGVLKSKYRQIRAAQLRIEKAELNKKNIFKGIKEENKRFANQLRIERENNADQQALLDEFLPKLKNARIKTKNCERKKKKGGKKCTYTTSYAVYNQQLDFDTEKAKKTQELLTRYIIRNAQNNHEIAIMGMLRQAAEIDIEIDLAIELYNSAENDFTAAMALRDNQFFLFKKSMEYRQLTVDEIKEKIVESRIMRSEAALNLARDMKRAVHRSYLAAKALEYKYLKPLENIDVDGGETLDIHDLYKAQVPKDVESFMTSLENYDTCAWGSVNARLYQVSLAKDILGLNDSYLEQLGAMTVGEKAQKRYELLQKFINDHIDPYWNDLSFDFSTSLDDDIFSRYHKYNTKIWWGTASPPCDPIESKGLTVMISTNQAAYLDPYITLTLDGTQTFLNREEEIVEYVPVSEYLNMQVLDSDDTVITVGSFDAFVNEDPDNASLHEWTNSFKGRSIASAKWNMLIEDFSYPYDLDWSKVTDITIYFDTMTNQLP